MTWIRFDSLCPLAVFIYVLIRFRIPETEHTLNGKMLNSFEKTKRKRNICFKDFSKTSRENQQIEFQGNHEAPLRTKHCIYFLILKFFTKSYMKFYMLHESLLITINYYFVIQACLKSNIV